MELTRRNLLKGAAALGAAGAVPATLARPAFAQTTQKKELVSAQAGDISKFDPHFSTSSNDIRVSFNIFDNLTSRHPDGKLYPGLATEWKLEGQTTWRFKLRPGVKFHNGDPFTSADAKWSLERTFDPAAKTMVATVFTTIDRIEAPDAMTLVIHTKKPDPLLPGAARLLRRPDRAEEVRGIGGQRRIQRQARRHGPDSLRVVGQGRQGRVRRQPRLLGRQDRRRPLDHAPDPRDGAARGRGAQGRGGHHHPAPPRSGRARQWQCLDQGPGRALRRALRARRQQQAAAARQSAGQAGAVAGHRPRGHREGAVARARHRAQPAPSPRATTTSTRACRRSPTTPRRRASGSRRRGTRARRSSSRPPWPTWPRTRPCPRPSPRCGRTSASTSRSR